MNDGTTADTARLSSAATELRYISGQAKVVALGLQCLIANYGVADFCGPGIARTGDLDTVANAIATLLDAIGAEATGADNAALRMVTDSALAALCVETARSIDPASAQAFWDGLTDKQRQDLIKGSPDVVVNSLIAAGVTLSPEYLAALEAAEAHVVLTDEYWAKIGGSMATKYCTVKLSKEISLRVQKLSDGSVLVTVIDNTAAGVSPPNSANPVGGSPGDMSLTALLGAGTASTFRFDSEEDAKAAVQQIRDAASNVVDAMRPRRATDLLQPWKQWQRVGRVLSGDEVEDILVQLAERLDRVTATASATGSASISLKKLFGVAGVNSDASLNRQLTFYRSEEVHGDDDYTAARLTIAGHGGAVVSKKSLSRLGIPSAASVDGSVSVEARAADDGTMYLTVSAAGAYATGSAPGKTSTMSSNKYAIDVKIAVTQDNIARVRRAVEQISSGTSLADALDPLYDESDITIATTAATSRVTARKMDGAKLKIGAETGKSSSKNEVRRKRRNGEWYSQTEVEDRLDAAQVGQ